MFSFRTLRKTPTNPNMEKVTLILSLDRIQFQFIYMFVQHANMQTIGTLNLK